MLINGQRAEELRVAIVADNQLENYQVDVAEGGLCRGNIYRGVVASVQQSLNAAFVEFGAAKHGFLAGHDVVSQAYHRKPPKGESRPRVEQILEKGKPILVQVTKDAMGTKGAALTTNLSLAGRYLVLTPYDSMRGLSRKVEDEAERKAIKKKAQDLSLPEGTGYIIRTNAADQPKASLSRDVSALLRLWKRILSEGSKGRGPRLLYSDQDLIIQVLRDYLDASIQEVLVDDAELLERAQVFMQAFMPRSKVQLKLYDERLPLFSRFGLEPQIDAIYQRTVKLPSGGSIVIDGTEALTAIDVNSGKATKGGSHEETVYQTNLEAAAEVARQLRIRDIGGLIVVDFIDMRSSRHQRQVEKTVRDAMKLDKARSTASKLSANGLMEINRQRIKQALQLRTHRVCPTCQGVGMLASAERVGLSVLRRIEARAAAGNIGGVRVELHPELADAIQNHRRRELAALEAEFDIHIDIIASPALHRSDEEVTWQTRVGPPPQPQPPPRRADAAASVTDLSVVDEEPPEPAEPEGAPRSKRKRRRRKSSRQAAEGPADAPQQAEAPQPAESQPIDRPPRAPRADAPQADTAPSDAAPSDAAQANAAPSDAAPSDAAQADAAQADSPQADAPQQPTEPKRSSRRRRSSRRKQTDAPPAEQAPQASGAPAGDGADAPQDASAPARKRRSRGGRRRSRRKGAATKPAE